MSQLEKNTVSSKDQLKPSEYVSFPSEQNDGVRILFLGNSITKHGVAEKIGWLHNWGMAASDLSKDYVHQVMQKVADAGVEACYCIAQISNWEREYRNGSDLLATFETAREFGADIIVWRAIENSSGENFDYDAFAENCKALLDYLNPKGTAKVIMTTSFWKHPGDPAIRRVAEERGYPLSELGEYGEMDEMMAKGLFEHSGVAMHPGDLGMKTIADEIWKWMKDMLPEQK